MPQEITDWLFDPTIGRLIASVAAIAVIFALVKLLQRSLTRRFRDNETRYRVRKGITVLGYLAAAFAIANIYSDRLTGLTVAFGVAGAGVAFALQEVIASVAGWIAISLGQFYRTGERVQLGGIRGDVIDIGVIRTTLMEVGTWVNADQYNGRIVRVANSFVFKEPVFNYSADFPFLWDEVSVPIRSDCDWRRARGILKTAVDEVIGDYPARSRKAWENLAQKFRIEVASVDTAVTMTADENWVTLTARYIVDYRKRRSTKDQIFVNFLEAISQTAGAVRIASAGQEITDLPPISIRNDPPNHA